MFGKKSSKPFNMGEKMVQYRKYYARCVQSVNAIKTCPDIDQQAVAPVLLKAQKEFDKLPQIEKAGEDWRSLTNGASRDMCMYTVNIAVYDMINLSYELNDIYEDMKSRGNFGTYSSDDEYEGEDEPGNDEAADDEAEEADEDISLSDSETAKTMLRGCYTLYDLDARYRALVRAFHPDTGFGDEELMKAVNLEYDRLREEWR